MRWVVWINGQPLLLGPGVEPTRENVNKRLQEKRCAPLDVADEIGAITKLGTNFMHQFDWTREHYPEDYTALDELSEV